MSRWHVENESVIVEKGDTLSAIAKKYLGAASKYKQLATINNIPNPDRIAIGQIIKIKSTGGSSSSSSSSSNSNKPTINQFGLLSNSDNTLFATWSWSKSNTASYKVQWTYNTGDGVWFVGENTSISVDKEDPAISRQDTYTIPNNARQVRFKVKPISEEKEKTSSSSGKGIIYDTIQSITGNSNKDDSSSTSTVYFVADWSDVKTYTDGTPLVTPQVPAVTIDKFKLTATLDNINITDATHIEFQVVKNNSANPYASYKAAITSAHASHVFDVVAGGEYKVRARAFNNKLSQYSDWSNYSNNTATISAAPSGITEIRATSESSVYLEWTAADTATSYDIEYATKEEYFDGSDQTTVKNGITFTHYEISGLTPGQKYFFRVRAVNSVGSSSWTESKSVVIGTKPAAPTTWSSTTTVITGEPLTLYWVHNTEDGSSQEYADLEVYANGEQITIPLIKNSDDEDEKDKTSSYSIDTSSYIEGTKIQWRVRTSGITGEYSDWSVQRTVDVYAPPTLELRVTDVNGNAITSLAEFPFYVYGLAGPDTQVPIGYHLTVVSNDIYETVDNMGNPKIVNVGDQVYSKYFDVTDALLVEMSANNIDLQNNIEYTVYCTVSMNSGLTAESSVTFTVKWNDIFFSPNASIGLNMDTLTTVIHPYCEDNKITYYGVTLSNTVFVKTTTNVGWVYGEIVKNRKTTTGEQVYSGTTATGESIYYCMVEENTPVTDVYLAVYRREFDGGFTEIASGLDGAKHTTVTDPHPPLDYARYRIVATSKSTGAVSFTDLPGHPVNGKSVVIQWDEEWTNFEASEDAEMERPPWAGSMLKLPYNIDVSDNNKSDVALIEYIGRSHPISYYGTQLGQSATWSVEIEKTDKETLYALRRLSVWMGDVYVREPSGSGYWANITVSFNQKHRAVTIPVTLNVTRVEGGV